MGWVTKLAVIGTILFLFGFIFGFFIFQSLIKSKISQNLALVEGTEMREAWSKFPIPVEFRIFLFNVTNPKEVHKGAKPMLQQVGPYCYDEWKEKVGFSDDEDEDEVSFHMKTTWNFKPDCWGQQLDRVLTGEEMITIPHVALLSLALMVEKDTPALLTMANRGIPHLYNHPSTIFLTAKVKDILFEGVVLNCTSKDFAAVALCTGIRMNAKGLHKVNDSIFKFSFFGVKNGTADEGRMTVKRGHRDVQEVGKVVAYNGKPELKVWDGPECNQLRGTDSTVFPPFIQPGVEIVSFAPDLCRSLGAKYEGPIVYRGLKGNHYTATLGDMSSNPEEKCFCPTPNTCHKKGIFDLTKCTGAPILLTLPHFLEVDPYYLGLVDGLQPVQEKHQIYMDFEPFTGTPLAARKRLQFNIGIHKIKKIDLMKEVPESLIPIFWVEEGLELDQDFVDMLDGKLFRTMRIVGVSRWILLILGLASIGGAIYLYTQRSNVEISREPAPPVTEKPPSGVQVSDIPRY
ncbi:sensory neuron membrane protein 1-like isoform X2 [Lycorma delicatula]|uniref:sensory neuron membrane protein 1-like isoform X2 n=1 Tax=Lycorma delicatula TaxID=130591 RepID=UPI003F510DD9